MHKALSAAAAVRALNSSVTVETHLEGLHPSNAVAIISRYDVVLDASDNPPTRYLISDACVACDIPLVSAAAVGTDGQLTVYHQGPDGPCYRCLFPECPAPANCARCADAGVLGPVPGVLGVLQALEAIKLLSGCGDVLSGRLLLFDALAGRFTTIKLRGRAAGCLACGEQPQVTRDSLSSYDYAAFTGGQRANDGPPVPLEVLPAEHRITPQQLQQLLLAPAVPAEADATKAQQQQQAEQQQLSQSPVLIDVRPAEQFAVLALPRAINMPFLQLDKHWPVALQLCGLNNHHHQQQQELSEQAQHQGHAGTAATDSAAPVSGGRWVVVMCRRGNHSQLVVQRLRQAGVAGAVDVVGGYEAWAQQVDSSMPQL
jgi:adenylyltransferase/sulfurtransferase